MSGGESNWRAWLKKAWADRLDIANNLSAREVPWDTVCYHAQQVAEKVLKAFLVLHGRTPPRTHDLVPLLAQCADMDQSLAVLDAECRLLTSYGLAARYPVDLFEPTEPDGRRSVAAADRVKDEILRRLPPP